jgi:large subunit ribosomal protein L11
MKKIKAKIKLQIPAGEATPAPPVGPALGQHGLNIGEFCNKFNAQTADQQGTILPVVITVYEDRTYDFVIKTPPASFLIKKAAGLEKGSSTPLKETVGRITKEQLKEIAQLKMRDLNTNNLEAAMKIIEGTAKSMGVEIVEE